MLSPEKLYYMHHFSRVFFLWYIWRQSSWSLRQTKLAPDFVAKSFKSRISLNSSLNDGREMPSAVCSTELLTWRIKPITPFHWITITVLFWREFHFISHPWGLSFGQNIQKSSWYYETTAFNRREYLWVLSVYVLILMNLSYLPVDVTKGDCERAERNLILKSNLIRK